jgi:hypothetical protein
MIVFLPIFDFDKYSIFPAHSSSLNTRPLLHRAAYSWNHMRGGTWVDPITFGALRAVKLLEWCVLRCHLIVYVRITTCTLLPIGLQ